LKIANLRCYSIGLPR